MLVVYDTLKKLEALGKEVITVYNKTDLLKEGDEMPRDFHADYTMRLSAKTGEGIEEFKELLDKILRNRKVYIEKIFDYKDAGKIQLIRKYGELLSEEYLGEGIAVKAYVPSEVVEKVYR